MAEHREPHQLLEAAGPCCPRLGEGGPGSGRFLQQQPTSSRANLKDPRQKSRGFLESISHTHCLGHGKRTRCREAWLHLLTLFHRKLETQQRLPPGPTLTLSDFSSSSSVLEPRVLRVAMCPSPCWGSPACPRGLCPISAECPVQSNSGKLRRQEWKGGSRGHTLGAQGSSLTFSRAAGGGPHYFSSDVDIHQLS